MSFSFWTKENSDRIPTDISILLPDLIQCYLLCSFLNSKVRTDIPQCMTEVILLVDSPANSPLSFSCI